LGSAKAALMPSRSQEDPVTTTARRVGPANRPILRSG
jgi:hypothetical protein